MGWEPDNFAEDLARLCDYYSDCLIREGRGSVELPAHPQTRRKRWVELPAVPSPKTDPDAIFASPAARALLEEVRRDARGGTLLVGWPVLLATSTDATGRMTPVIAPVLLFAFAPVAAGNDDAPSLSDEPPQVNYRAVELLMRESRESVICELVDVSRALGLSDTASCPDPYQLADRLRSLRPDWPWIEPPQPGQTAAAPPTESPGNSGIYNRALLILSEQPPYTRNLLTELAELRRIRPEDCARTALGAWLAGAIPQPRPSADESLLEPLPLNDEQRAAVVRGLHNPLTVITGPPGTGKSQVVMTLLINAAWRGLTALFASRNNQAVDVVETRVNRLGANRLLMRLGTRQHNEALAQYLSSLLCAAVPADAEKTRSSAAERLKDLQSRRDCLARELSRTIALRNEVDALEQEVESVRRWLGDEAFAALRETELAAAESEIAALSSAVKHADRQRQPAPVRLIWRCVSARRYAALAAAARAASATAARMAVRLPAEAPGEKTIALWAAACEELERRLRCARSVRAYFDRLHELTIAMSPGKAAAEHLALTERICETSRTLWKAWLDLLPLRLTGASREALSQYAGLICRGGGRGLNECFADTSAALPAWAITSLSASGRVPLAPGVFDLLIIDEASQCDIPSALPLLLRARRAVIIGDPNQLRHITSLDAAADEELFRKHGLPARRSGWLYSRRSLFDLACGLCGPENVVGLRDHHRSHPDIIAFSNSHFYRQELRIATRYKNLRPPAGDGPAVRWVAVPGRVIRPEGGGALNEPEAHAVVSELRRLVLEGGYDGEVGVVTPFRAQQQLINALIERDAELSARLRQLRFQAATAHSFQGDERDVMIFSPVYSRDMPESAVRFLISTPNIFNVAITRARSALIVVGDFEAAVSSPVVHLAQFARYASELARRDSPAAHMPAAPGDEYPPVSRPELVTCWHRRLYAALRRAGISPVAQHAVEQYLVDLAVMNARRPLAIDLDAQMYHRIWNEEHLRRDRIRAQRLLELGWTPLRFWIYQVRDDLDRCVAHVKRLLEQA